MEHLVYASSQLPRAFGLNTDIDRIVKADPMPMHVFFDRS